MQDQQSQFYLSVASVPAAQAVQEAERIFVSEAQQESFSDGGSFLPLSVWERKGYDPIRIAERTQECDKKEDPVLGTVYRVRVLMKIQSTARLVERSSGLKRPSSGQLPTASRARQLSGGNSALAIEGGEGTPLAITDGRASDAGDGSGTAESSNSSRHHRKKKHHKRSRRHHKKSSKHGKAPKDYRYHGGLCGFTYQRFAMEQRLTRSLSSVCSGVLPLKYANRSCVQWRGDPPPNLMSGNRRGSPSEVPLTNNIVILGVLGQCSMQSHLFRRRVLPSGGHDWQLRRRGPKRISD